MPILPTMCNMAKVEWPIQVFVPNSGDGAPTSVWEILDPPLMFNDIAWKTNKGWYLCTKLINRAPHGNSRKTRAANLYKAIFLKIQQLVQHGRVGGKKHEIYGITFLWSPCICLHCVYPIDFFPFLFRFLVEFDEFYRIIILSMDGEQQYSWISYRIHG